MSVFLSGIAKHLVGTGSMEHISRLRICTRRVPLAYTSSESIVAPSTHLNFGEIR